MERLPEDKLLKYNPDTLYAVRKIYNLEKPGQMKQAVDILEAWVQKQQHFMKKDFSRDYLERVIIQLKGSVERAKSQLDKICTLRTVLPKYYEVCNPREELKEFIGYSYQTILPNLTESNLRIYIFKIKENQVHTQKKLLCIHIHIILSQEYIKAHDYCDGVITVCDLRGLNITEIISHMNLTDLQNMTTIATEGYDARLKSIHFLSASKAINLLIQIVKSMMPTKIANRVHVHKTIEDLYEFVPQNLLPKDYGGDEDTLEELSEKCLDVFSSEENIKYWTEMRNARTDECKRLGDSAFNMNLGLAGTFKTLSVD